MNAPSSEDLADEVVRAIRRIVRRISEHSRAMSSQLGLTVPQLLVLKAIGQREERELTVAQVAESVQLSAATTSRIIDRLERNSLVLRERRAKDRRKVCLSLTPKGMERFSTLPVPLHESFMRRLLELDEGERTRLLGALHRVVELMGAEDVDASPVLAPGADIRAEDDEV